MSALLFGESTPGRALRRGLQHGTLLLSSQVVQELDAVLHRPKFDRYVTLAERERFLSALIRRAELVAVSETITVCRDPKDDQILDLAVTGKASMIVTGDSDLLALNPFQSIPVVTAAEFLQRSS